MNPRDKMTLNPAPITNPGRPLRRHVMAPSRRFVRRGLAAARRRSARFSSWARMGRAAYISSIFA